jgi:hypothetical protein
MHAKRVDPMREEKRVTMKLMRYVRKDEKIEFFRSYRLNQCLLSLSVLPIFSSNLASSSTKSSSSDQSYSS